MTLGLAFDHGCSMAARSEAAPFAEMATGKMIAVKLPHAKIGELTLTNDILAGALGDARMLARARR